MRKREIKKRERERVTFRSHSLRMQTKEQVSLRRRSEKVPCYCSPSHYEAQNRRNLTRQNNETTRERGWKEAGKQEIMKTSLISADASSHLSCHCWNQYKFYRWDVLKNAWLWKLFHLLSRRCNLLNRTMKDGICWSGNPKIFTQSQGGLWWNLQVVRNLDFQSMQWSRTRRSECRSEGNDRVSLLLVAHCAFDFYSSENCHFNKMLVR